MSVRIAINGFGRIGRLAFRQMFGTELFDIVAINDLTSPKMLAHLLKYDSTQGTYHLADKVTHNDNAILIAGHTIPIYAESDACKLPWGELGVDVVLECTGFYTSREKASSHLKAGAKKVVISAPAGDDIPTIVYNVNHKIYAPATASSPLLPAPPTAWRPWRRPSTTATPSSPASCVPSTVTPATR